MSLYPWSKRKLEFASPNQSPFPRYGAASNATASTKGDIYLMGGLINGAMVKGDLWIVEVTGGNMTCIPVATMAEGPGPRVGHRALLVGNAFIVFGGDTKVEEMDVLDDTLYLLNTCKFAPIFSALHLLTSISHETLVARSSRRPSPGWPLRPHLEHPRL